MKKKVLSKDEVKKRQDKIIWTTRIVGVVLFLIGISIIFVTAFIRSRQPEEPNDDVVIFESTGDNFTLHHNDKDIIEQTAQKIKDIVLTVIFIIISLVLFLSKNTPLLSLQ